MDMLWRAVLGSKQNTNNEDKLGLKMITGKVTGHVSYVILYFTSNPEQGMMVLFEELCL